MDPSTRARNFGVAIKRVDNLAGDHVDLAGRGVYNIILVYDVLGVTIGKDVADGIHFAALVGGQRIAVGAPVRGVGLVSLDDRLALDHAVRRFVELHRLSLAWLKACSHPSPAAPQGFRHRGWIVGGAAEGRWKEEIEAGRGWLFVGVPLLVR